MLDTLEILMDEAWRAPETENRDGWMLRSAGSVTQRANSVWPASSPAKIDLALRDAVQWYSSRRQPVIFQLTHRPENAALEALLDQHRYSRQSETVIMTAPAGAPALANTPAPAGRDTGVKIVLADTPSEQWLDLWWRVDGRGGAAERHIARSILLGTPSVYATAVDGSGAAIGTGRITLVETLGGAGLGGDKWGGVYGMAVHPEFRRRGVATAVLWALLDAGRADGAANFWLMVTAANTGAQGLYGHAGFVEAGRYHYRQAPLHRAPSAC
ncbi:hypothetical protein AL755_12500 [Arthrobacter sp. ERGS1:01]|nr:hypothetical protein AL755_12500 [Arthrobacter sp. ERGS1:01]